MRLLLDQELEHLLRLAMLSSAMRRGSPDRHLPSRKAREAQQRSVGCSFSTCADEAGLEDDGEVRGGHEVRGGGAGEDGEKVEEVEEEVAGCGGEEGDELAVFGDGVGEGLGFLCELGVRASCWEG